VKPWYEELFSNYARAYDREAYTQGTLQEVAFIEAELGTNKRARILDVGCGTGRHAIELARHGYSVTGIDLSASQLARARE
jgi:2-polyprenyl-3-methyl-5-hydroxy-6-metoxy-1,4-benzoquinol methylase